ncbi:MAG TPA: shikimate dehydrogenase [Panacibacter sp.]|mgnify:CR=1 FL=1|nr:shikimate dehydrogenase [Panacibacter sp.]HNP45315.1 shikimate dehydrogenase [Panacibacter sp.]
MITREFGLIGYPLSHSFSQKYFTSKFEKEGIDDAVFHAFSIPSINDLPEVLRNHQLLKGFAITIPYKREVIPFLHYTSTEVKKMKACNCVQIKNGQLFGHNTDATGFERSFVKLLKPYHQKALILGTGGASSAVEFALQKIHMPYKFVSRTKDETSGVLSYEDLDDLLLEEYKVVINCTPLGTYPKIDEAPDIPYQFLTDQHYLFDLVYNPATTKFLARGEEAGSSIQNGYEMLVLQAEENWRIWNI